MEPARNETEGKILSDLADDDWGAALHPKGVKLPPRVATVTRAVISLDDCTEQPVYQKSRTQFLASNYVGEVAVLPGAWSSSNAEDTTAEQVMYLADPKPIGQDPPKVEGSTKSEKGSALESEVKSHAASKGVDGGEDRGDKRYFSEPSTRRSEYDRK